MIHRKNSSTLIDRLVLSFGFVLLILSSSISNVRAKPFCYGNVDLVFVVDASYSISDQDFAIVCNFVIDLYSVILENGGGSGNLRAGVVMYASTVYEDDRLISLSDDPSTFVTRLKTAQRDLSNLFTNTYEGLARMLDMFNTDGRPDSTKVAILITDDVSDDPEATLGISQTIKTDYPDIFVIAISHKNSESIRRELLVIASDREHALIQTDLTDEDFLEDVQQKVCAETLDQKTDPEVDQETLAMDIVFLLPEASVLDADFQISKDFIKTIIRRFEISATGARVGVIKYGESVLGPAHYIALDQYTTESSFFTALDALNLNSANSRENAVHRALERFSQWVDQTSDSNRPVAAVLLTADGAQQVELAIQQADMLRKRTDPRVYLNVIGLGTNSDAWESERNRIAYSDATSFYSESFLGIAGGSDDSTKLIEEIRATISRIGRGTLDSAGPGAVIRWNNEFDIIFMLDGSEKVSSADFQVNLIKFVVKELIDEFDLFTEDSANGGRVGVIVYDAAGVYNMISIGDYENRDDLMYKIDILDFIQRTEMADNAIALEAVREYFEMLPRESAAKLAYMITWSTSGYPLLARAEAQFVTQDGIQLMIIGVGDGVSQDELNSLQLFDGGNGPVAFSSLFSLASTDSLDRLRADLEKYAAIKRPTGNVFRWAVDFDFIVMLHDESGRENNGIATRNFLQSIFSRHDIGPADVRVGVITFGANVNTGVNEQIILGQSSYLGGLVIDVFQMPLIPTGGPNVEAAFDEMRAMFNIHGRNGVPKVALLITQGISLPDSLDTKIADAKVAGIKLMSIGIGPETESLFMQRVASNDELAFAQTAWPSIEWTTEMDAGLVALAMDMFQPQGPGDILRLPTPCGQKAAIIFVIDASPSISSIFDNVKAFVAALISGFELPTVQIGTFGFATNVLESSVILPGEANTYIELYLLFEERMQVDNDGFSTNTNLAIERMTQIFSTIDGTFEKIGVVVTDGKSSNTDATVQAGNTARQAGIDIIAIGAGDQVVETELVGLTGEEALYFAFADNDFTDPVKLQSVQEKICILSRPGECGPGNFRDADFVCQSCRLKTYQPEAEELFCEVCPPSTTTLLPGAQQAADCIRDCSPGTRINGGDCEDCPIGQYQNESAQQTCKSCPPDRNTTPFLGASSIDQCTADVCDVDMDLIFVVDTSSSIGTQEFALLKSFLVLQVSKFNISQTQTRIGIVPIGSVTRSEDVFGVEEFNSESDVIQAFLALQSGSTMTNTASAISMARQELDQNSRDGIPRVILVITDEVSQEPGQTAFEAVLAREKGYVMIALGLGTNVFERELNDIAPGRVYFEQSYSRLPTFDLSPEICSAARQYIPPEPDQTGECSEKLELIIVMDLSESTQGVVLLKAGLVELLDIFASISPETVRIGVFAYGQSIHIDRAVILSGDANTVANGIIAQFKEGDFESDTAGALEYARELLIESRPDVAQIVMIFTNGASDNFADTVAKAAELRERRIYTIAIDFASGNPFETGLKAIGTAGSESVVRFDSTPIPTQFKERLKLEICIENFVCSFRHDVVYIWDVIENSTLSKEVAKLTAELSKSFSMATSSVVRVGLGGSSNLESAIDRAADIMLADPAPDTVLNLVIISDKELPNDITTLKSAASAAKSGGVRIMVVTGRDALLWGEIASSAKNVFPLYFLESSHLAWFICKEPCESGYEIKEDGLCDKCEIGYYRDATKSHQCVSCDDTTTTIDTGATSPSQCLLSICEIPMDLIFLIDASESIGLRNFGLLKAYLWNLIDKFPVGLRDEQTRVAHVTIGEMVTDNSYSLLTDSTNALTVQTRILRIIGDEPRTNTGDSIRYMAKIFRDEGRVNVPKVSVVITDGRSVNTFQTKKQSAQARLQGVSMVSVGIGNTIFREEINAIASTPEDVFIFQTFNELFNFNELHVHLCEVARNYKPPGTIDPVDPLSGDCSTRMDLVFILDASTDVSAADFTSMQAFVVNLIDRLDIGLDKIRAGIMAYSYVVHPEFFPLDSSNNKLRVSDGVFSQSQKGIPGRNTVLALGEMINIFESARERNGVSRVAVLMKAGQTGGLSDLENRAIEAKNEGIHVISIGFGDQSEAMKNELEAISTDADSILHVERFSDLEIDDVIQLACAANFECTVPMEIYMIWDLTDIETIIRAERFMETLDKEFTETTIMSVFIDHLDNVAEGVVEGLDKLLESQRTQTSRSLLIITDKELTADTKAQLQDVADLAKSSGILVIVVDAHSIPNGLDFVASSRKLSFMTDMFDVLPSSTLIKQALCTAPCPSGTTLSIQSSGISCEDCPANSYRDALQSFTCTPCPNGETSDPGSTSRDDCSVGLCLTPMDIVYVIDASESIFDFEFNALLRAFLYNTMLQYDIGVHRVGLVPFSNDVYLSQVFDLGSSVSKDAVLTAVNSLTQDDIGLGTNTAKAIDTARDMLLSQGRREVMWSIVVITDGVSDNRFRTSEAARKAREDFIRVIGLGVGNTVFEPEIRAISSQDSALIINSFTSLALTTNFVEYTCEDSYMCGKDMEILVFEETAGSDLIFTVKLFDFNNKLRASYTSTVDSVVFNQFDLESKIDSLALPTFTSSPAKTKVFLFITISDISQESTIQKINSLRESGGVVALVKANTALDNRNFVQIVSNGGLLFETRNFNENPYMRHIERQLCIDSCTDGYERNIGGVCVECGIGYRRTASETSKCVQCPDGKTTVNQGSVVPSACIPDCGAGTYTVGEGCEDCDIGEYQPEKFQSSCITCPNGLTTVANRSVSEKDCIVSCEAGTRRSIDGLSCIDCPKDFYQPEAQQTFCEPCPVNLKTTGTKSTSVESCQGDCSLKMDVIFLVDASTSVSLVDFQLVKAFIVNTISRFVVSQTDTRFGIITFARNVIPDPMLELDESVDRDTAINKAYILIQGLDSGTNMRAALSAASDMFDSQGLSGRPRRVVLITDGIADNRELTEQEASQLKSEYVHITCIGVGPRAFLPLLRNIATNPDEVIYENSFAALASKNVLSNICGETCLITMDVYLVSYFAGNQQLESRLNTFRTDMSTKFPNSTVYEPVGGSSLVTSLSQLETALQNNTDNPSATKSVVIVTNQQNTEGPSVLTIVDRIKDLGYIVAVIYVSTDKTDLSYNSVVSDKDLLFFAPEFDFSPYSEYIMRTVCIPPCGDGTERNRLGLCSECERGTYRSSTVQHVCEPCSFGQTTNNAGAVLPSDCINCVPENWLCADGLTCIPLTQLCDGNNDCGDGSDEICNDCEAGTFWDQVLSDCIDCPKGTYQDIREQNSCKQCPPGSSTAGQVTTSLSGCNITCDQSGEELDLTGTQCVPCDIGYYRDLDLHPVCNKCPDGFTTVDIRSTSEQDCVPDCLEGEAYINNQCEECPPNTFQPQKYQTSCEICPDGTTSPAGNASCMDPCPAGQQYNYASASCEDCPENSFATVEMVKCQPCPFNFITFGPGSMNIDACFPDCGAGSYWNTVLETCSVCNMGSYQPFPNRTECFACPVGKITELAGSDSLSDCIVPCNLGEEVILLNGNCKPCDIGYYREDPTEISCSRCEPGWTTESAGSVSKEACIRICPSGSRREGKQCVPCELGTYQTQTGQVSCLPCPEGLTTQATGTNQEDLCLDLCPAGSELSSKDPLTCNLCAFDKYRQKNVDYMCVQCEPQFITISQGAKTKDECLPDCRAGESWDSDFGRCEKCSVGSFQPLPNQFQCAACPLGWTTESIGKTSLSDCLPDCIAGRRWESVALQCVDCGLGQYQPLPYQTSCIQCPSGTTTSTTTATQESDCRDPCPGGQELPAGQTSSTDCVDCPPNTYKDPSLDTECQPCPPGFITVSPGSSMMSDCLPNCEEGSRYDTLINQCVECPEGTYQDLKYQYSCKPCDTDGFITLSPGAVSSSLCVSPCLAGYEWSGNRCEPCEIGKYQDEPNKQSCKMCPTGQTTNSLQSDSIDDCFDSGCLTTQFECEDGQCIPIFQRCDGSDDCTDLSDEADDLCIQCPVGQRVVGTGCDVCPVGTYQNMPNKHFCIPCPRGEYTDLLGSTLESDCKECQAGYQFIPDNTDPKCKPCPVNQYREPGSASCSTCPLGFVTLTPGTISLSGCLPDCGPGKFYDGNACVDCPIGQYQDLPYSRQCKQCPDSKSTAQEGTVTENDCIACPAGSDFTPGDTSCRPCPENYYKSDGDTKCLKCRDGFVTESVASTLSTDCKPNCEPGFYYQDINSAICTKCPWGQYQPEPLQDACIFCDPGLTTLDEGASIIELCIDVCPSGTELNDLTGGCDPCLIRSYKERGRESTCQKCDNNFTTSSPRAPSKDYCVPDCGQGEFWDGVSCQLCPPGFYQDLKYQTRCTQCPEGTFVAATGTISRFECKDQCPEGEELLPDNQGSFVCRPCPIGEVKVAPQTICTECPPGFTTADVGSVVCVPDCQPGFYWDGQDCLACPKGTYQEEPYQESCSPCPPGRYTRETASTDVNRCIDICPSGTELQFDGTCRECLMNYYRTQGQDPLCKSCPGQFFTRTEGSVSIDECLPPCLAGTYWDTSQSRCSACPEGSYQDRDYQKECKSCGAGLTTLDSTRTMMITGATSQAQCYADCKEGEMVMSGSGLDLCESCPKGTYQERKYQDTCIPCLEGLTTIGTGSRERSDCYDPCESGRTYNPTTEQCDPCGFSRYRDRTMHRVCKDCQNGFITLIDTASECIPDPCLPGQQFDGTACFPLTCIAGTFFDQNNLRCSDCPPGTYQDVENQRTCKMCPTGTTSSLWSTQSSDCYDPCPSGSELPPTGLNEADCIPCNKGWYKKKGETTVCVQCSPNKTTRNNGSSQAEDCISDCKAGTQINNRNDGCDVCEVATYQPEELQPDCIDCEEGLTTDQTGSTDSSDCIDICNSGFELQPDKRSCMECPKGKYREKGVNNMCEECDPGFTTETIASATRDSCVRDCKKGEGFNPSSGMCEKCPVGFYQPNPYNENCLACPSWKTTLDVGADDAAQCIDPCKSGTYRDLAGECQSCPRGSYRVQNVHSTCQNCRPSFTTLSTGTASESECVPNCGPATHWSEVFQRCVSCEPNTFNKVPYQFECQQCPPEYPINEDDFLDCRKECPPGETWNRERKACNWCDKGQYRPQTDPNVCTPCPGNTTTLTAGKASLSDCIPDCSAGQFWHPDTQTCVDCPPGTIQTALRPHNETMCDPCPGTISYQPMSGQTSCLNCTMGQIATVSKQGCKTMCEAGQYWNEATGSCESCPQKTYQATAGYQESCQNCPKGSHTAGTGSTSADDCKANWCPSGQEHNGKNCVACRQGFYSQYLNESCRPCPDGMTTFGQSSTSITDCFGCGAGELLLRTSKSLTCLKCQRSTYQDKMIHSDTQCKFCPPGKETKLTGSTSLEDCQSDWCPSGKMIDLSTFTCVPCAVGYYRERGKDSICQQCPGGFTTSGPAATSSQECIHKNWCGAGKELIDGSCQACLKGTYKPAVSDSKTCHYCPNGTTTAGTGSVDVSQCTDPCPDGQQYLSGYGCGICGYGLYKDADASSVCLRCPSGMTTYRLGACSISECKIPHCHSCVDLLILVDNSNSANDADIDNVKEFLEHLVHHYHISPDETHIGVIRYATIVTDIIHITAGISHTAVVQAIMNNLVACTESEANTAAALARALEIVMNQCRSEAMKNVLLITDETLTNAADAISQADQLKALDVTITVIGVNDTDLSSLASNSSNFFPIDNYQTLPHIKDVLPSVC